MTQRDYLDALRRALFGLPPALIDAPLSDYAHRFSEGVASGRHEADIAKDLDDPRMVAAGIRATTNLEAFRQSKNVPNAMRLGMSGLGLLILNLFLVVPVIIYSALLAVSFAVALGLYGGGIVIAASSLADVDEYVLSGPLKHMLARVFDDDDAADQVRVSIDINRGGISVADGGVATPPLLVIAPTSPRRTELHFTTREGNRPQDALRGVGIMIGGIALFLFDLIVAKYSVSAMRRYARMNMAVWRAA